MTLNNFIDTEYTSEKKISRDCHYNIIFFYKQKQ